MTARRIRFAELGRTVKDNWPLVVGGLVMTGVGVALEVANYEPSSKGIIIASAGAVWTLGSSWPFERADRHAAWGVFESTLKEIRNLPELSKPDLRDYHYKYNEHR